MRKQTGIWIEADLIKMCKDRRLNVSKIAEDGIRDYLGVLHENYRARSRKRTGYKTCQQIMENLKEKGYTNEIPIKEVIEEIKLTVGLDKRTTEKYSQALRKWEFIIPINDKVYQINKPEER